MDPRHYPDHLVTASSDLVFDKLICGNSILDTCLSLKTLKHALQFLVYFAEHSAKLAFELPVPSRVEARFGNEKGSILVPLFESPVEFAETEE